MTTHDNTDYGDLVDGAEWCVLCQDWYLPILGIRGCPWCEKRGLLAGDP